jgi:hypothetical protein
MCVTLGGCNTRTYASSDWCAPIYGFLFFFFFFLFFLFFFFFLSSSLFFCCCCCYV